MLEMLDRATAALLLLSSLKADCWLLTWTYHPGSNPNPHPDLVPDPHRLLESDDLLLPLVNGLLLLGSALVKELLIPGRWNSHCNWLLTFCLENFIICLVLCHDIYGKKNCQHKYRKHAYIEHAYIWYIEIEKLVSKNRRHRHWLANDFIL